MRRAGFLATLAAGVGLLGASIHGMTNMNATLKLAAATPTPAPVEEQWQPDYVRDRDCHRGGRHDHPRV